MANKIKDRIAAAREGLSKRLSKLRRERPIAVRDDLEIMHLAAAHAEDLIEKHEDALYAHPKQVSRIYQRTFQDTLETASKRLTAERARR